MRPRREVLVISDCAVDGANLAYVLRVRGSYDAWTLPSEIDRLPQDPYCTLVLCRRPCLSTMQSLVLQTAKVYPASPVLYIALENEGQFRGNALPVDRILLKPSIADLLEAVRIMVARKRGPKSARAEHGEKVTA